MTLATPWLPSFGVVAALGTMLIAHSVDPPAAPHADEVAIAPTPRRTRILYITEHVGALPATLASDHEVVVRAATGLPARAADLATYDLVIVSDVQAHLIASAQVGALEDYATGGGAVLVAGGIDSFGSGAYQATRLEKMLPVYLDSGCRQPTDVAVVLVVDPDLAQAAIERATRTVVGAMSPNDVFGVVAADTTMLARPQRAGRRDRIVAQLGRPKSTRHDRFAALRQAGELLDGVHARIKHVIVLSEKPLEPTERDVVEESKITIAVLAPSAPDRALAANIASASAVDDERVVVRSVPRGRADLALDRPPPLGGHVSTRRKAAAEVMIETSDLGEPILARWCRGAGTVLAWTSDVDQAWSADWSRWGQYPAFWRSVVRGAIDRRCAR